jgi:tetratricopeptide (TPR) repeat protein
MRAALVLLAGLALAPAGALAQEPACALRCREMAQRKELMEGLSEQGCMLRLCHEEGRRLYLEARYEEAFAALDLIEPRVSDSPAYQLDRGLVEYARGNFAAALAAFDQVAEREPESLRAGAQRANALVRLERFGDARAQFEKLLALPASRTAQQGIEATSYLQGNLGALCLIQSDVACGRTSLEKALERDAGNNLAATYLHRVLPEVEAGRLDGRGVWLMRLASEDAALHVLPRASAELAELLERSPLFAEAWYLQADILRSQRQYEACEKALAGAQEQLPKEPGLRAERLRCQLLREGGASAGSRAAVEELMRLGKQHPDSERIRSILRALSGN